MRIGLGELSVALIGGGLIGLAASTWSGPTVPAGPAAGDTAGVSRQFGSCHTGGGTNCVVDGDTFWIDGEKIRVADIDAPETHPSRCPEEARLGNAATDRLQALLNAGPVTLAPADRDTDRYGRKLRVVMRGGKSLGEMLVREGLARRWIGHREPWC
jgi:micrococcal nuclease